MSNIPADLCLLYHGGVAPKCDLAFSSSTHAQTLAEVKTGEAEAQEGFHLLWKLRMTDKDKSYSTLCAKARTP